jgi:diguanylate cyclase (GGDEF)-like protein/PAS domain S-box-containing protein
MINIEILQAAVMDSRDGITISDFSLPDNPLIFVNPAFERMTGYLGEDVEGKNCRYLQGSDKDQEGQLNIIREAINQKQPCLVTFRNYRKDGSMFWNELSMSPIFDADGKITHYLGIQKDITNKVLIEERLKGDYSKLERSNTMLEYLVNIDALTGVYNRRYLEEQLRIQWQIAIRQKKLLTIFMLDLDHFKKYNDTYGHPAGDEALKRIAQVLSSSFLKSTDFVARYGGEEFIILTIGGDPYQIAQYAESVVKKVSALTISHSGSDKNIVTVSLGFSSTWPSRDGVQSDIIKQADQALYEAKKSGRNRAISYSTLVS